MAGAHDPFRWFTANSRDAPVQPRPFSDGMVSMGRPLETVTLTALPCLRLLAAAGSWCTMWPGLTETDVTEPWVTSEKWSLLSAWRAWARVIPVIEGTGWLGVKTPW